MRQHAIADESMLEDRPLLRLLPPLKHHPEKWTPVFG